MRTASRFFTAVTLLLTLACGTAAAPSPTPPPLPAPIVVPPPPVVPAPPAPPALAPLARASDVLPPGEVSGDSLVVRGDGYRFQIPPTLQAVSLTNGITGYRGDVDGMITPAELTIYVTHAPFAGDLDALTARETTDVTSHAGTVDASGPTAVFVAGTMGPASRIQATVGGVVELRVLAVHGGEGYVLHCETPGAPNAWVDVGSDCMIKGVTLHIAPPTE